MPVPDAAEFAVSIVAPDEDARGVGRGLLELLDWILNDRREKATLSTPLRATADPLFLYGVRS